MAIYERTFEEVLVDNTPVLLSDDHTGRFRLFGRLLYLFNTSESKYNKSVLTA